MTRDQPSPDRATMRSNRVENPVDRTPREGGRPGEVTKAGEEVGPWRIETSPSSKVGSFLFLFWNGFSSVWQAQPGPSLGKLRK